MAPRRPLPDLCIIQVVKMLLPNDQLTAARMSPRSAGLVRAANRRVTTLVITRRPNNFATIKWTSGLPGYSALSPSVQLLPPATTAERPNHFPDHLPNITTTARLSRWNYLLVGKHEKEQFFADEATIELIVTIFSAVTELQFAWQTDALGESLVALLERPQWARQLTRLTVNHFESEEPSLLYSHLIFSSSVPLSRRLAAAINELPALQCLSIGRFDDFPELPPDLGRMTQLRVLAISIFKFWGSFRSPTADAFLSSLERYAAGKVANEERDHHHHHHHHLQVHLHLPGWAPTERLLTSSPALCRRIVGFHQANQGWADFDVPRLCRHFPSLNSISLCIQSAPRLIRALFAALSSLPQLVHLALTINGSESWARTTADDEPEIELGEQWQSAVQLRSLRALDLELNTSYPNQPQWLNMSAAMPRLQAVHLKQFSYANHATELCKFLQRKASSSSYTTELEFFRSILSFLFPVVPYERFILGRVKPYPTLKQLLSTSW